MQKEKPMKRLLIISFVLVSISALAKEPRKYVTETDKYIVWQPGVKLTFDMFMKSEPTDKDLKSMKDDNRKSMPYLGFYRVLDVPKHLSKKKSNMEKAYFCATFSKHQSYMAERDSFDLQIAQAHWDIIELGTRKSRMVLDNLQKQADSLSNGPVSGVKSIYFETAYQEGNDLYNELLYGLFKEVILPRDKEMYIKYRGLLDELLLSTDDYATTPEEAERLLLKKPIDKNLKQAKNVIGDLRKKD